MPTHKQAKKRVRQTEKRRLRNKAVKTHYRSKVSEARSAVEAGDAAAAESALVSARRALDKAVSKGVLHKNTAARYKSSLARSVNAFKSRGEAA